MMASKTESHNDQRAIDAEKRRRQRGRNWAVLLALVSFCVIVYAITLVRLTGH